MDIRVLFLISEVRIGTDIGMDMEMIKNWNTNGLNLFLYAVRIPVIKIQTLSSIK